MGATVRTEEGPPCKKEGEKEVMPVSPRSDTCTCLSLQKDTREGCPRAERGWFSVGCVGTDQEGETLSGCLVLSL